MRGTPLNSGHVLEGQPAPVELAGSFDPHEHLASHHLGGERSLGVRGRGVADDATAPTTVEPSATARISRSQ